MRPRFPTALASLVALVLAAAPLAAAERPDPAVRAATSLGSVGLRLSLREIQARQAAADLAGRHDVEDAEEGDEERQPDRTHLPQNPASPDVARLAAPGRDGQTTTREAQPSSGTAVSPAPTVGLNFTGAGLTGPYYTGMIPPDPMGAAGPTQFVLFVNGRIVSFDKTTGVPDGALNANPNVFFGPIRNGYRESDPRIRYDRQTGRWFLVNINVSTPNRILFAVSDSASHGTLTANTVFTFFFIDVATTPPALSSSCFADYPTLGIDHNALYIGTNNFCPGYSSSDGYVIRKSSLLGSGPLVVTVFRGLVPSGVASGPFTPQGVDNLGTTGDEGYFIGADNASYGTLVLRRVSDPGGTPTVSANIPITVPATRAPLLVDHLGNTGGAAGRLSSLDDRLLGATIRNGRLWTAHSIGVNNTGTTTGSATRNGARWYELAVPAGTGTPTVVQSGTVYTPSSTNSTDQRSYWYPTVAVSGPGHAAMALTAAGVSEHANAAATARLTGDAAGAMAPPILVTNSTTAYNPAADPGSSSGRRWGDYSGVSVDPMDDMTMWTVHMWCNVTDGYGVQVTQLLAPPPATPASVPDVTAGENPVTVTLTGASVAGSGFYDPGPDPAGDVPALHHLAAAVLADSASGTPPAVIGATWLTPTTVQLVLDASGATASSGNERYTVRVTNPDGQAAAAAVLRVVPGSSTAVEGGAAPGAFGLGDVRPNPSRGAVQMDYALPREARVRLAIVDVQGREIAVLASGRMPAGRHTATWTAAAAGRAVPRGAYFARLQADGKSWSKRFVVVN